MSPDLRRVGPVAAALLCAGLVAFGVAHAQGGRPRPPFPPPPPIRPLERVALQSLDLQADIRGGVATIALTHVLSNPSPAPQEGDFVFPIPPGAVVRDFALYDGETRLDAEMLDRDRATAIYEQIVRQRRDPALLAYAGQSALRVRVFPIAPGATRRVTLKLTAVLPREGMARRFAWAVAGPNLPRPEQLSVRAVFHDVGSVYSPTHAVEIRRDTDTRTVVRYVARGEDPALRESPELVLFATPTDPAAVALGVLTHRVGADGTFLILASPNVADAARTAPPRRVVLVMDRSGSMAGKKMEQARGALKVALHRLRPQDSFNVLTFSDRVERFSKEPIDATKENLRRASAWVDDIVPDSGTNIDAGLQEGLAQFPEAGRGNTLLFFTDGLPTVGNRDQKAIVEGAVRAAARRARVFVFGVGYDVDVPFLDTLAERLRGDADYVRPDEDIEAKTARFVARTSTPVLENLKLKVDGVAVSEIYPQPESLPDLFDGGQLAIVGRYKGASDSVRVTLTGEAGGRERTFALTAPFPAQAPDAEFLPRLWASRKIGHLMDLVRLSEPNDPRTKEIVAHIVALSKEHGILTPYTALFVPEPGAPVPILGPGGVGFGGGLPADALRGAGRAGEGAVNLSQANRAQKAQAQVGNRFALGAQAGADRDLAEERARRIQNVAGRAFYQRGPVWEDATYDPKKQTEVVKVRLFSDAYFALVRRNRTLARWAALGAQVRVAVNARQAVEFGDTGKETLTEAELKALAGE